MKEVEIKVLSDRIQAMTQDEASVVARNLPDAILMGELIKRMAYYRDMISEHEHISDRIGRIYDREGVV